MYVMAKSHRQDRHQTTEVLSAKQTSLLLGEGRCKSDEHGRQSGGWGTCHFARKWIFEPPHPTAKSDA